MTTKQRLSKYRDRDGHTYTYLENEKLNKADFIFMPEDRKQRRTLAPSLSLEGPTLTANPNYLQDDADKLHTRSHYDIERQSRPETPSNFSTL